MKTQSDWSVNQFLVWSVNQSLSWSFKQSLPGQSISLSPVSQSVPAWSANQPIWSVDHYLSDMIFDSGIQRTLPPPNPTTLTSQKGRT